MWFVEWSCDYLHFDLVYVDVCVCVFFDRFRLVEFIVLILCRSSIGIGVVIISIG